MKPVGDDPLDYIRRELALRAVYESAYGIFPHGNSPTPRPFALQAAFPKEDYLPYSTMARDYQKFIDSGIKEKTGESMAEFFRRPRHEVELIFSLVRSAAQQEYQQNETVIAEAKKREEEARRQEQQGGKKQ